MKKRIIAATLLATGAALTGLAGSAYAEGSAPATKPTGAVKERGLVVITCTAKSKVELPKGKPDKGIVTWKNAGKPPVIRRVFRVHTQGGPPPGAKVGTSKTIAEKGGKGDVKIAPPPKGAHCFVVRPGTPGGSPPAPTP